MSGDTKRMVCKLKKSIYGLKQASRQWYYKVHQVIISSGFEMNMVDDCIYHKFSGSKHIYFVKPEKNSIFLKKSKTVILVENRKFSRSRMTKRTAPLNSSREI